MNYTIKEVQKCYQSYDNDGNPLVYSGSEWECVSGPKNTLKMNLKMVKLLIQVLLEANCEQSVNDDKNG